MNIPTGLEAIRMMREAQEEDECHEDTKHESEGDAVLTLKIGPILTLF